MLMFYYHMTKYNLYNPYTAQIEGVFNEQLNDLIYCSLLLNHINKKNKPSTYINVNNYVME